jgi:hypothetical protein
VIVGAKFAEDELRLIERLENGKADVRITRMALSRILTLLVIMHYRVDWLQKLLWAAIGGGLSLISLLIALHIEYIS